jgi:hypothetical protein
MASYAWFPGPWIEPRGHVQGGKQFPALDDLARTSNNKIAVLADVPTYPDPRL